MAERTPLYEPLDQQDIRLLRLLPGLPADAIHCELVHGPLAWAQDIGYETVSYCWGRREDTVVIRVDGISLVIPSNAQDALRRFRGRDTSRTLWMDSICINQADVEERGRQVSRMHKIYHHGQRNLIWLGEDDGTVQNAIVSINAVLREARAATQDLATLKETMYHPTGSVRHGTAMEIETDLAPLARLLARPWFTRLWVVQECGLARANAVFCGTHELPLENVLLACEWLSHQVQFINFLPIVIPGSISGLSVVVLDHEDYRRSVAERQKVPLRWFLTFLRGFEAIDLRDYIYGLLGLYQHAQPGMEELPQLLKPDYAKSPAAVYRDAARYAIIESGTADILSRVYIRPDAGHSMLSGLPSWAADQSVSHDRRRHGMILAFHFNASASTPVVLPDQDRRPDILQIGGLLVDQPDGFVERLSSICYKWDESPVQEFYEEVLALLSAPPSVLSSPDTFEALARTLLAGNNSHNLPTTVANIKAFDDLRLYHQTHNRLPPYVADLPTNTPAEQLAMSRVFEAFHNQCLRKRFFVTKGGRLGLGPQDLQVGDVIAILFGAQHPYALRHYPENDTYTLVGACYVHGVMYGEAVEKARAEGQSATWFSLR